jgi:hypothetical protein
MHRDTLRIELRPSSNAMRRCHFDLSKRRFGLEEHKLGEQYAGQRKTVTDSGLSS